MAKTGLIRKVGKLKIQKIYSSTISFFVIIELILVFLLGWSINKGERELHYRLSIYYAQVTDSGTFTCVTPEGSSSSIAVEIRGENHIYSKAY